MLSALAASCPSAVAAPPKGAAKSESGGEKSEEGLDAALHKTSLTRASGLGLDASGVGFGMLRQREDPLGKSLRAPGRGRKTN
jgi:hypothetical protein